MSESVASLLNRLGTPPQDLIDHLTERFKTICGERVQEGHPAVTEVDPENWLVTSEGDLFFRVLDETNGNSGGSSRHAGAQSAVTLSADELAAKFRKLLTDGAPTVEVIHGIAAQPIDIESNTESTETLHTETLHTQPDSTANTRLPGSTSAEPPAVSSRVTGSRVSSSRATHYSSESDAIGELGEISDADRQRRDKMAEMLTASLTERFGSDVVSAEPDPEISTPKYEIIQRDRRFNWNLVLGVVTVVVVGAIGYAGYNVSENRRQRVAFGSNSSSGDNGIPSNDLRQTTAVGTATPAPAVDETEIPPLPPPSESSTQESDSGEEAIGVLETIESLQDDANSDRTEAIDIDPNSLEPIDIEISPVVKRTAPNQNAAAKAANETLDKALELPEQPSNIPEAPQTIRPAPSRYAQLPTSPKPGRPAKVAKSGTQVVALDFPVHFPIDLVVESNGALLVNSKTDTTIGKLFKDERGVMFDWEEPAIRDSFAKRLMHGRLGPLTGQPIYLRPSIETDPFHLSLRARDTHPTWNLGGEILSNVTRLDVELNVPNSLEYGWSEPFDSTDPSRGSAVAILTPPDGESVAVAVQVNVRCDRRLSCNLKYAARLAPSEPWLPITREGLMRAGQGVTQELSILNNSKDNFDRMYAAGDSAARRLLRKKGDVIEESLKLAETTMERLTTLKTLVEAIEESVTLDLHLYVQWADDQQTILRTSTIAEDAL